MEQTKSRGKSPAARILSLALALCMIAAFVPAMSIGVSAATAGDTIEIDGVRYRFVGENLITNGDFSSGMTGWTNASTGAELDWTVVENSTYTGGTGYAATNKVSNAGGAAASTMRRFIGVEEGYYYLTYNAYNTGSATGYGLMSAAVLTKDGPKYGTFEGITFYNYNTYGGMNSWSADSSATQEGGSITRSDYTYAAGMNNIAFFYTAPEGAEHLMLSFGAWTTPGQIYWSNFSLYKLEVVEQDASVTINYVDEAGAIVAEAVKTEEGLYSGDEYTPSKYTDYYADETTATLYEIGDVPTVTLEEGANTINVPVKAYKQLVDQGNGVYTLVTNGGFEDGTTSNWTAISTGLSSEFTVTSDAENVSEGTYALSTQGVTNANTDGAFSLMNSVEISEADTYYMAFDIKGTSGTTGNIKKQYIWLQADDTTYTNNDDGSSTVIGEYVTVSYVDDFAAGTTVSLRGAWFGDTRPYIDNFVVYQLADIKANVTVNCVCGDETFSSETYEAVVGESYAVTPNATMTKDGTTYVLKSYDSIDRVSAVADNNVITIEYDKDSIKEIVPTTLETREGVMPALPTEVTANLTSGGTMPVSVEWDTSEIDMSKYSAGDTFTVTGTAEGYTATATVTVVALNDFLIARYEFEEDGKNSANEGTYTAEGTAVTYESGVSGNAAYFDGSSSYFAIDGELFANETIQKTKSVTISAFVKTNGIQTAMARIFDFGDDGDGTDLFYTTEAYNYNSMLQLQNSGAVYPAWNTAPANRWTHIAVTVEYVNDNAWTATVYANGEVAKTYAGEDATGTFISDFTEIGNNENADYYIGRSNWEDPYFNGWIDDFRVYSAALTQSEIDALAATVTVNYTIDGDVMDDLTYTEAAVNGGTITTDAVSAYVYNGHYYNANEKTFDVAGDEYTAKVELVVDTTKYAPTSDFSYNFTTGAEAYPDDTKGGSDGTLGTVTGGSISFGDAEYNSTMVMGWNNIRQTIMTYDISDVTVNANTIITSANLNMYIAYANVASYTIAAIDATLVDTETPKVNTSGTYGDYSSSELSNLLSELGAVTVASGYGVLGWNEIELDLSSTTAQELIADGTLALIIYTTHTTAGQIYICTVNTDYGPYLSDVATTTAVSYTVKYLDENETSLQGDTTYNTTAEKTYGYNDEVICPYVTIPYFENNIFTSKEVDTENNIITLHYTSTEKVDKDSDFGSNFFSTVTDYDTQFVSLNMLGAHNAFTSSISTSNIKYDAGGVAQGDSGSTAATLVAGQSTVVDASKAQDKNVLGLLEAGVRYFDVRLSRSTAKVEGSSFLYKDAPHTNGVFYTTHGLLSDEFRPIAYTIGQWLKEHPGEVIALYFQEAWDDGDASATTYADIAAILDEAGISDFAPYYYNEGTKLYSVTYGNLTDDGNHAGVVMFAREVGYQQGHFYYGSTSATYSWAGKLYSYYDSNKVPKGEFDADYIQKQVDTLDLYNVEDDGSGDHPVYHMARVMQAQSEMTTLADVPYGDSLLEIAQTTNGQLYSALTSANDDTHNYSEWLTALPIVMINGVGGDTYTSQIAKLLQSCNAPKTATINYTVDGTTVATEERTVMIGTMFTENQYTFINGEDAEYYVNNNYTTKRSTSTLGDEVSATIGTQTYTLHDVTYIPYDATKITIDVPVTKLGNVYTAVVEEITPVDTTYYENTIYYGDIDTAGTYTGLDNFGALNWQSSYEGRIGVAILKKPTEDATQDYYLTATLLRNANNSSSGYSVDIYAIDYATYKNITSLADLKKFLTTDYYVGSADTSATVGDTVMIDLSETAIDKIATENVVLLGASVHGLYGLAAGSEETDDAMAITTSLKDYGIDLIGGAQIRVGSGATEEALAEDSGLRFIADVSFEDTLASIVDQADEDAEGYEIGIAIYDGGYNASITISDYANKDKTPVMKIPMKQAQKDADGSDSSIYTVAITNINPSNFNRIYIAVPYVTVDGETYYDYTEAVARTPYQVAAGILVNDGNSSFTVGNTTYTYTASSETLIDALNLYANLTGARIELTKTTDEETGEVTYSAGSVKYSNGAEVFFTLTAATDEEGYYVITLSPRGSAEFNSKYAVDKFRANNATAESFLKNTSDMSSSVTLDESGNLVIKFKGTGTAVSENAD